MKGVLPARFYGDPSEVMDELREMRRYEAVLAERELRARRRRIKRLIREAKGKKR